MCIRIYTHKLHCEAPGETQSFALRNCPAENATRITGKANGSTTLISLFIVLDVEIRVFINRNTGWQMLPVLLPTWPKPPFPLYACFRCKQKTLLWGEKSLKTNCYCHANHTYINNNVLVNIQINTKMTILCLTYFENNDLMLFFWTQQGWGWNPETTAVPI